MGDVKEGGCQCGALRYRVNGEPIALAVCHCRECQRQSGSAFGMSLVVPKDSFQLLSGEPKTFTRTADSGRSVVCGHRAPPLDHHQNNPDNHQLWPCVP